MPFCPECKAEYVEGVKKCHDCDTTLVDTLPVEDEVEVDECGSCGGDVEADADYCPHCGSLLTEQAVKCSRHPAAEAEGVCIICKDALCPECIVEKGGRMLCESHKKVEISEDWAVVFESADYIEANLVNGRLENAGITLALRNNNGIGFIGGGMGDSLITRTVLKCPVKIFVPVEQYQEALAVVQEPPPTLAEMEMNS